MPGGRSLRTVCEAAVICASAALMLTFGWKIHLDDAVAGSDCDSICSMSLTCALSVRS